MPVTVMGRLQLGLGLAIPILLLPHLIYTRFAHEVYALDDRMALLTFLLWDTRDGWLQSLLLLIVWVHGCIGLHLWLRGQRWWRRALPVLSALAALVPAFALAGFLTEGRLMKDVLRDAATRAAFRADVNWPDGPVWGALLSLRQEATWTFLALLGLVAAIHLGRRLIARRASVPVRYRYGPDIRGRKGLTLLEMSRAAGVPHTSLCGGKGRCTTCRVVIEEGGDTLPPPGPAEARSLDGLGGPPGTRLACMIRPEAPLAVYRVFRPDGRRTRAHASTGEERTLAILFLDMRGFTGRTTGQLPYDVVFLLNRFFDAIVPAIVAAGGTVDKYLGEPRPDARARSATSNC
jgi:adenylate cyclase